MKYDRERRPAADVSGTVDASRAASAAGLSSTVDVSRAAGKSSNEPSLGDLFGELAGDMSTLVRKEVNLAKTEMTDKATTAGKNIAALVAGGVVAYTGLLVLLAALVMGLDEYMATGLAALLVGGVLALIGGILVMKGIDTLKNMNMTPDRTIETLKEDKEWLQDQTK